MIAIYSTFVSVINLEWYHKFALFLLKTLFILIAADNADFILNQVKCLCWRAS